MKIATQKVNPDETKKFLGRRPCSTLARSITEYEKICHLSGVPLEVFLEIPAYIRHGARLHAE